MPQSTRPPCSHTMTVHASEPAGTGSHDESRLFGLSGSAPAAISTPALITAMLDSGKGISDLIFSPGRPPQVEKQGELTFVDVPELPLLRPDDTARVARDLVRGNAQA